MALKTQWGATNICIAPHCNGKATQQLHLTDIRAAISIPDEVAAGSYL
jgi:hypothetical protein